MTMNFMQPAHLLGIISKNKHRQIHQWYTLDTYQEQNGNATNKHVCNPCPFSEFMIYIGVPTPYEHDYKQHRQKPKLEFLRRAILSKKHGDEKRPRQCWY